MITFTRAPRVTPGEPILASQFCGLADAVNDRIKSGLGNGDRRIVYYLLSLFRSIRNGNEDGNLVPSIAEFFTSGYQQVTPDRGTWPTQGPGDPEGANLTNLMAAYVFGSESAGLHDEATRLTDPAYGGVQMWYMGVRPPSTPSEFWWVKRAQIGAWDPETGAVESPVMAAARSHSNLRSSRLGPIGNSAGAYFALPELVDGVICEDPNPVTIGGVTVSTPPPNYRIRFTALTDGLSDKVYDGTCQPVVGGEAYSTHVADIIYDYQWMVYRVRLNNGTEDVLPMADYMEGPYTGQPRLGRTFGAHLDRVTNRFIADFRGRLQSDAEETGARPGLWNTTAADLQRFLTTQYLLAPQRGTDDGDEVWPYYPKWFVNSAMPAGLMPHKRGGQAWPLHSRCVCTAAIARGRFLDAPVTIEIEADGEFAGALMLAEEISETMLILSPCIAAGSVITMRSDDAIAFRRDGGFVEIEITEQMEYKPGLSDFFLLCRLGAAAE